MSFTTDNLSVNNTFTYDGRVIDFSELGSFTNNFTVGVGNGTSKLMYSYNGNVWNSAIIGVGINSTNCIAYNGLMWLAGASVVNAGEYPIVMSLDGMSWTGVESSKNIFGVDDSCLALMWDGQKWLAGGNDITNVIAYSTDGVSWTGTPNINNYMSMVRSLAYGGNVTVAGGEGTYTLCYSTDGFTWASNSQLFSRCNAVATNGDIWVAGGGEVAGSSTYALAYSVDGINWQGTVEGYGDGYSPVTVIYTVAWNGVMWLAGGADTTEVSTSIILYSYDGVSWNTSLNVSPIMAYCTSLCWNGNVWIAGGWGGSIVGYSADGLNWTAASNASSFISNSCLGMSSRSLLPVAPEKPNTNTFVTKQLTVDGQSTTTLSSTSFTVGIISSNDPAIPKVGYSYDGKVWQVASGAAYDTQTLNIVIFDGQNWYAGGELSGGSTGALLSSQDGKYWTSMDVSYIFSRGIRGLATDGISVVAGTDSYSTFSPYADNSTLGIARNGENFIPCYVGNAISTVNSIGYNGKIWLAAGHIWSAPGNLTGCIAYSYDGYEWNPNTLYANTFPTSFQSLVWNGNYWLASDTREFGAVPSPIVISYDGLTWTGTNAYTVFSPTASGDVVQQIVWNGNMFVCSARNVTNGVDPAYFLGYSTNGVDWTGASSASSFFAGADGGVDAIVYNGNLWNANGHDPDGNVLQIYSYNGITWFSDETSSSVVPVFQNWNFSTMLSAIKPANIQMTTFSNLLIGTSLKPIYDNYVTLVASDKKFSNIYTVNSNSQNIYNNGTLMNTGAATFNSDLTVGGNLVLLNSPQLSAYDTTVQSGALSSAYFPVKFSTNNILNGWSHTAGSSIFTVSTAGTFSINWNLPIQSNNDQGQSIGCYVTVDGSAVASSFRSLTLPSNSGEYTLSGECIATLSAGSTVELYFIVTQTTITIRSSTVFGAYFGLSNTGASITITKVY